jgi:hypothetical protein
MTAGTRPDATPPGLKQIEDAALEVQTRARQAADHAGAGDWRKAHAAAEQAQGACRVLKEMLGAARARHETR